VRANICTGEIERGFSMRSINFRLSKFHDACLAGSLLVSLSLFYSSNAQSCTAFELSQSAIPTVGKSFDWMDGFGLILTNKRNVSKQALVPKGESNPLRWRSRFGSLTFNQLGREFPYGGVNEKGLTVEVLVLETAVYPPHSDPRPSINDLQWIQFILDNAATLSDAISLAKSVRLVSLAAAPLHYFVCDAAKFCGVFESINGKLVVSAGSALPVPLITNYPYSSSISNKKGVTYPNGAVDARFQNAVPLVNGYTNTQDPIAYALKTLAAVAQTKNNWTKWNIVYQPTRGTLYFRSIQAPAVKRVNFSQFDFSCKTPTLMLDINSSATGDVTKSFRPYDASVDAVYVRQASGHSLPPQAVPDVLSYSSRFTTCQE
jgi:choloylglycine hydrolase